MGLSGIHFDVRPFRLVFNEVKVKMGPRQEDSGTTLKNIVLFPCLFRAAKSTSIFHTISKNSPLFDKDRLNHYILNITVSFQPNDCELFVQYAERNRDMVMKEAFEFRQCITLLKATGSSAKSLRELRDATALISERSLYHHVHQYFLKGHMQGEYTNDFAQWAGESLEESELSEELSNISPYGYEINALRAELIRVMDRHIVRSPEPRHARPGDDFYFNETVTLIYPAGVWARNLAEFLMAVKYIDISSIYYHFFDSRQRTASGIDDFSSWFSTVLNKKELTAKMALIDPYVLSLEVLRERIVAAVEEEVKKDMETAWVYT
jgi:hypothetical protein